MDFPSTVESSIDSLFVDIALDIIILSNIIPLNFLNGKLDTDYYSFCLHAPSCGMIPSMEFPKVGNCNLNGYNFDHPTTDGAHHTTRRRQL